MRVPLVDLKKQYMQLRDEILQSLDEVMQDGRFILGPQVEALEGEIARYTHTRYGIGVANGTDALVMALRALGIGPGDEVITSPFTFFASAEGISNVGATPVFVDIDPKTYCMDVSKLEERITERTRAIIPVHIFGHMVDMDPLMELAEKYHLKVVEDACQAIGSTYKGRPAGSIGNIGCFSFFPTKNLGGYGDGGMIVTSDEELTAKIRLLRHHGSPKKYHHVDIGYNSRLDAVQAAILRIKFPHLDRWNELRREKAAIYGEALRDLPLHLPYESKDCRHVYHLYVIATDLRDQLMEHLKERGVASGIYYPVPLHLQPVYQGLGYKPGDFPNAEAACRRCLAIPMYPELEADEQAFVIRAIKEFFEAGAR